MANLELDCPSEQMDSLLQSVADWYGNLSLEVQQVLLYLVPFRSFVHRGLLGMYAEGLQQWGEFPDDSLEQLDGAVQRAIEGGWLVAMVAEDPRLLSIRAEFSAFLRTTLDTQDQSIREALQAGFKQHYLDLAASYQQLMNSRDAQERQLGTFFCTLEYENLYSALHLCLAQQEPITIYACLSQYFILTQDRQKVLELGEEVYQTIEGYPEAWKQENDSQYANILNFLAYRYLQAKHYPQARQLYQQELQLQTIQEDCYGQARAYHELGMVALELHEYEEARVNYENAMQIWLDFSDRYNQARTYHELGMVALALRQFEQARGNYQLSLQIKVEYGDRYNQAVTHHQLGRVALELHEYEKAQVSYEQALEIWVEYSDRYNQARTHHDLGLIAQALGEYENAQFHYKQALEIWVEYGDLEHQAGTYEELGRVALELREYKSAQLNYERALQVWVELGDRYNQVRLYSQLGQVAEELGDYQQAWLNDEQALQIWVELGDRYNQAVTYDRLGYLAEVLGRREAAKISYLLSLEIMVTLDDQQELELSLQNLARFYRVAQDPSVMDAVAQLFKIPVEQVRGYFAQLNRQSEISETH